MKKSVKRRHFLNGAAIALAAGSTVPGQSLFASGADAAVHLLHAPISRKLATSPEHNSSLYPARN